MKKEEVDQILAASSTNNEKTGVTGMLLYRAGFFIQLLEGEQATVRALYAKIEQDSRHRESRVLLEFEDEARLFPRWYMGVITEAVDSSELFNVVKGLQKAKVDAFDDLSKKAATMLKDFSKKYSRG